MKRNLILLLCFLSLACQTRKTEFFAKSLPNLAVPDNDSYTRVARDLKQTIEIEAGNHDQEPPTLPETAQLASDIENNADPAIVTALPDKPSDAPVDNPQKPKTPTGGKMWYFLGPAIVTAAVTAALATYAGYSYKTYKAKQALAKAAKTNAANATADAALAKNDAIVFAEEAKKEDALAEALKSEAEALKSEAEAQKIAASALSKEERDKAIADVKKAEAQKSKAISDLKEAQARRIQSSQAAKQAASSAQEKLAAAELEFKQQILDLEQARQSLASGLLFHEQNQALIDQAAAKVTELSQRLEALHSMPGMGGQMASDLQQLETMRTSLTRMTEAQHTLSAILDAKKITLTSLEEKYGVAAREADAAAQAVKAQHIQELKGFSKDTANIIQAVNDAKKASLEVESKYEALLENTKRDVKQAKEFEIAQERLKIQTEQKQMNRNLNTAQALEADQMARNKTMEAEAYNKQAKKFQTASEKDLARAKYATAGAVGGLLISAALGALAATAAAKPSAFELTGKDNLQAGQLSPQARDVLNMLEYRVILLKGAKVVGARQ